MADDRINGNGYPHFAVEILNRIESVKTDVLEKISEEREKSAATEERLANLKTRCEAAPCDAHTEGLAKIETAIATMPTKDDIEKAKNLNRTAIIIGGILLLLMPLVISPVFAAFLKRIWSDAAGAGVRVP